MALDGTPYLQDPCPPGFTLQLISGAMAGSVSTARVRLPAERGPELREWQRGDAQTALLKPQAGKP